LAPTETFIPKGGRTQAERGLANKEGKRCKKFLEETFPEKAGSGSFPSSREGKEERGSEKRPCEGGKASKLDSELQRRQGFTVVIWSQGGGKNHRQKTCGAAGVVSKQKKIKKDSDKAELGAQKTEGLRGQNPAGW